MNKGYGRILPWCAWLTAFLGFLLIVVGSLISSSGYGLAIPDWPLSHGALIPTGLAEGSLYEFTHRSLAALAGLLTLGIGTYLWARDPRPEVQRLGSVAILLILLQILLGGTGVLSLFPTGIRMLHAALAHFSLAAMVAIAVVTAGSWFDEGPSEAGFDERTVRQTRGLASMTALQVVLGAVVRHATLSWVWVSSLLMHVVLAVGVVISGLAAGLAVYRQSRDRAMAGASMLVLALVLVQMVLGTLVLVTVLPSDDPGGQPEVGYIHLSAGHVSVGSLLLATSLFLALRTWRGSKSEPR